MTGRPRRTARPTGRGGPSAPVVSGLGRRPSSRALDLTAELLRRDGHAVCAVAGEQRLEASSGRLEHFAEEARLRGLVLWARPRFVVVAPAVEILRVGPVEDVEDVVVTGFVQLTRLVAVVRAVRPEAHRLAGWVDPLDGQVCRDRGLHALTAPLSPPRRTRHHRIPARWTAALLHGGRSSAWVRG